MNEDLILYNYTAAPMGVTKIPRSGDYNIAAPGCAPQRLQRGVDFGMIKKPNGDNLTKTPTLYKPGAEKVAVAYGLCQHYCTESAIEDAEKGFFFYRVRCDLVAIRDGREFVITSAYGSANTREKRNGTNSPYDGANSAIKMAQKRALVSAALSLGCLSDMFTQDIESDTEDAQAYFNAKDPETPISAQQVKFFYACASRHGLSKADAKKLLAGAGYASAKDVKTKDFDALIEKMSEPVDAEVITQ